MQIFQHSHSQLPHTGNNSKAQHTSEGSQAAVQPHGGRLLAAKAQPQLTGWVKYSPTVSWEADTEGCDLDSTSMKLQKRED
jgi:hypothetical protein